MMATTASTEVAPLTSQRIISTPPIGGGAGGAWEPGSRVAPPPPTPGGGGPTGGWAGAPGRRGSGRPPPPPPPVVPAPARERTSDSAPTATTRPACTARAVASGCLQIAALRTIRSADIGAPDRAAGRLRYHE